jgi:hypothetical protein
VGKSFVESCMSVRFLLTMSTQSLWRNWIMMQLSEILYSGQQCASLVRMARSRLAITCGQGFTAHESAILRWS